VIKRWLFRLLGKDPRAVIVTFWSGDAERCRRMFDEILRLVPDREHFVVSIGAPAEAPGAASVVLAPGDLWLQLRRVFRRRRIALAAVLFTSEPHPLRAAAFALAPTKILAYNANLERHHFKLSTWIASLLFWRGVPADRISLRPSWLFPWKKDRTRPGGAVHAREGRPPSPSRPRVAVLSPYFPYPLAHGGAVRIFHLLREAASEFDIHLYAFAKEPEKQEFAPLLEFCAKVTAVEPPRYREPRWSTLHPPEAGEFESPAMRELLKSEDLMQVEYTQLARYGGRVLVEHDVTWDLYRQVYERRRTLSAWWDYWRWRRFETRAVRRFPAVVAMAGKDAALLGRGEVIENGVDLDRFQPEPEPPGMRLLFIGSFSHFPNVEAFRFFYREVWPRLDPDITLTVVAGRDPLLYWTRFAGAEPLPSDPRIEMHAFVGDVRPLYAAANLALAPTTVSAGTNLKVLEAMAMERAVVSTSRGCAGLGLRHGESVWIADDAAGFAAAITALAADAVRRRRIARAARAVAERHFSWKALGEKQRALWRRLLLPEPPPRPPLA
jgi:glycosyltransferase involved in cell wall biosynthesis